MSAADSRTHFSRRTSWSREPSDLETSRLRLPKEGLPPLNLTETNPTACGFAVDGKSTLLPLCDPQALVYEPDPRGIHSAREAVAAYYRRHGAAVPVEDIVLTASTSEAYSHLFRMLCDPGDEILIARPSYPLFQYLADLSDVTLRSYPLFFDHGWCIDTAALESAISPRTRAIVVVHPNNPTGHASSTAERNYLRAVCERYSLALIVDEVFLDYAHGKHAPASFAAEPAPIPTFVLNGLSKIAALPQMKVGWIVTLGPELLRNEALARLEIIADTFLSVGLPPQLALPTWLDQAQVVQAAILARIAENLAILRASRLEWYEVEAGWSAILRLPRIFGEATAFHTLLEIGILTHPADFYGLVDANRVVISLILPTDRLRDAVERMARLVQDASRELESRDLAGTDCARLRSRS